MTEQDLIDLGFEKNIETAEDSGSPNDWHYYTYDFCKGLSLITQASDQVKNGEWYVEFFEVEDDIRFTDRDHLSSLMDKIELART